MDYFPKTNSKVIVILVFNVVPPWSLRIPSINYIYLSIVNYIIIQRCRKWTEVFRFNFLQGHIKITKLMFNTFLLWFDLLWIEDLLVHDCEHISVCSLDSCNSPDHLDLLWWHLAYQKYWLFLIPLWNIYQLIYK